MRVSCAGLDLCQGHDRRSYPDADPEPNRSRDRAVSRQMVHDFKFQVPVYIKIALLGHRKNEWKKGRKKKRNQSPIYNLSLSLDLLWLWLWDWDWDWARECLAALHHLSQGKARIEIGNKNALNLIP